MIIFKEFNFDSAHFLPKVPATHPCSQMHGHTYRLRVLLEGVPEETLGWILDFKELKGRVEGLLSQVDHHCLNQVDGLENPTCEQLIVWIWKGLKPLLPKLCRLELYETPTSGAIYEGN
jgi:6-pyruvoyltetrahydropterin/6-carboxytetrahydropterin synthase